MNHKKTLVIWTNPSGCCRRQLEILTNVIKVWTDRLCVGWLPTKWAWVSYFQQLWAKLRYGQGVNSSPVLDLEQAEQPDGFLRKHYRRMLPLLGFNHNIKGE